MIEDGYILHSSTNAFLSPYPGVNDWMTVSGMHAGYYFEYAVLPQDWLGGTGADCALGDGYYCGGNGVSGNADTLYVCAGGSASVYSACANGCAPQAPGTDDWCR